MARWFAWDNETALIEPGYQAPRLACSSVCEVVVPYADGLTTTDGCLEAINAIKAHYDRPLEELATLYHWTDCERVFRALFEGTGNHIVGANIAFDMRTLVERFPLLLTLVLDMYEEGRVHDTQNAEKLLDIARGTLGKHPKTFAKLNYSLDDQYQRVTRERLDKDTWRLRYGELAPFALEHWPEDAKTYPKKDAQATALVWSMLAVRARMQELLSRDQGVDSPLLANEPEQARASFALGAASCWGLRTHGPSVEKLAANTQAVLYDLEDELALHGLIDGGAGSRTIKKIVHKFRKPYVRGQGTRNTKAAADRLVEAARDAKQDRFCSLEELGIELTDKGEPSLSADACKASPDPIIRKYGAVGSLSAVLSKDIPALTQGIYTPIHTRFGLAASGRGTSAGPNVQNWANKIKGVRECFIPRDGFLFAAADVGGLELATLAEVLLRMVGWSKLAEAILAGRDAHADLACEILGIALEEGERRKALGKELDPEFYLARQTAKVANFGFPGGLGFDALVDYARALYGIVLTPEQARQLKETWLRKWPEMREYFRIIHASVSAGLVIKQLYSNRYRGGLGFTAACNTYFQGLGADAMKRVSWELTRDCFDHRRGSILLGSRIVNFIHDEFILEVRDDALAHDKAVALGVGMNTHIRQHLKLVPATAEPLLMRVWSKDAKPVYGPDGRLIPWEPKKQLAT